MKYWIDTEFIEDGHTIDLISIGIVAEDGRDNYWQNRDCQFSKANEWVHKHVFPHLEHLECDYRVPSLWSKPPHRVRCDGPDIPSCPWRWHSQIRDEVIQFCNPERYGKPEFWGYYADYDWVALCQLFGRMIDLPKGWPMYCRDIKQWADELGNPRLPMQDTTEHHALADAQWNRQAWDFLAALGRDKEC